MHIPNNFTVIRIFLVFNQCTIIVGSAVIWCTLVVQQVRKALMCRITSWMLQRIMEVYTYVRGYGFNEKFQFWYIFKKLYGALARVRG
jgi:hypothetical protein